MLLRGHLSLVFYSILMQIDAGISTKNYCITHRNTTILICRPCITRIVFKRDFFVRYAKHHSCARRHFEKIPDIFSTSRSFFEVIYKCHKSKVVFLAERSPNIDRKPSKMMPMLPMDARCILNNNHGVRKWVAKIAFTSSSEKRAVIKQIFVYGAAFSYE